jgi:hypothetical protein
VAASKAMEPAIVIARRNLTDIQASLNFMLVQTLSSDFYKHGTKITSDMLYYAPFA